ncbi:hypothetical protein MTR67_007700 [Solanum verrucosum]|uniref:Uncharacterized protein n=1 Tax=Solanum verrucosum TaxID=315347 RepID=A0AAF0Q2G8_SOLVR|nr:hypothetical protein MTR67_007700 [Solanum verrucosum]
MEKWRNRNHHNNVHKLLLQIVPICIFWEIWKSWTSCKFGDKKKFNTRRMETQILWNIKATIGIAFPKCKLFDDIYTWLHICQTVERMKPVVSCKVVVWKKPTERRFKLNSDGSFLNNNNRDGIRGIIRDVVGDLAKLFLEDCHRVNNLPFVTVRFHPQGPNHRPWVEQRAVGGSVERATQNLSRPWTQWDLRTVVGPHPMVQEPWVQAKVSNHGPRVCRMDRMSIHGPSVEVSWVTADSKVKGKLGLFLIN